jgi:MFS family permease
MYAFRKPFAAGTYESLHLWETGIELKTAFIVSQLLGYALSKYIGVKICSEATRSRRLWLLAGCILFAEAALLLFAFVPVDWKVFAIFANGLPLGMVWGLVVWQLEGRRTSDLLLAVLCCSFVVASGAVKSVGLWLMEDWQVGEFWMPATTGLVFLPAFLLAIAALHQLPAPTREDEQLRTRRRPMHHRERMAFLIRYLPGLVLLFAIYCLLTAFRDFRDNFQVEILTDLGYSNIKGLLATTELFVALAILAAMAMLNLAKKNASALRWIFIAVIAGGVCMAAATLAFDAGYIDGVAWMILVGFGAYLAYVPFNAVMFERLIAYTGFVGTAVFAINVADALGYTGSVVLMLTKDLLAGETNRLTYFRLFAYGASLATVLLAFASGWYFLKQEKSSVSSPPNNDRLHEPQP